MAGTTPAGAPLEVELGGPRTVLFFLTSSCYGCRAVWEGVARTPSRARVILVTPSQETESAREVTALAPPGLEVLMSSEAWHALGITGAPWFVVAEGGVIVAEGAAPGAAAAIDALIFAGPDRV